MASQVKPTSMVSVRLCQRAATHSLDDPKCHSGNPRLCQPLVFLQEQRQQHSNERRVPVRVTQVATCSRQDSCQLLFVFLLPLPRVE